MRSFSFVCGAFDVVIICRYIYIYRDNRALDQQGEPESVESSGGCLQTDL